MVPPMPPDASPSPIARAGLSTTAMVLAAGLGTRLRPITLTTPKPLVPVGGKAMLDHVLDRMTAVGVSSVVVNVHHLSDLIVAHMAGRDAPAHVISDERARILDSGGGTKKALAHFGGLPFLLANSDTLWLEGANDNVARLLATWDPARMDVLLLLAARERSVGFDGRGDFAIDADGRLTRRGERPEVPYAYAGFAIFRSEDFAQTPDEPFSLNLLFDRAAARHRLFGCVLDGVWMHVGDPASLAAAEARYAAGLP
jgi:N-acetyl-alpha-D-muramate 1-phosphate uridylyltransferase